MPVFFIFTVAYKDANNKPQKGDNVMWLDPMAIEKARVNGLAKALSKPHDFYVNCGGYAFGVEGWYIPADHADLWEDYHHCKWRNLERKFVKYILHDFSNLRLATKSEIDNLEIDLEKYEIVAFRIRRAAFFCDFHFMRCERNGDWTEKRGSERKIYRHPYEDIYDIWDEYDGKIFFFVRERTDS